MRYQITYHDDQTETVEGDELDVCYVDPDDKVLTVEQIASETPTTVAYVLDAIRKDGTVVWYAIRSDVKYVHELD